MKPTVRSARITKKNHCLTTLILATTAILIAVAVAIYLYIKTFGTGLSSKSQEWAEFGAFIGGVFSPLISFVALIALLITIYIQKAQFENQKHELQRNLIIQKRQLIKAKQGLESQRISDRKNQFTQAMTQKIQLDITQINLIRDATNIAIANKNYDNLTDECVKTIKASKDSIAYLQVKLLSFTRKDHSSLDQVNNDINSITEEMIKKMRESS